MEEDSYDSYNNDDIIRNNIDKLDTEIQDNIKTEENLDLNMNLVEDEILGNGEEENENNNENSVDIEEDDILSGENIVINIESEENNKVKIDNKKYLMKNSTAV